MTLSLSSGEQQDNLSVACDFDETKNIHLVAKPMDLSNAIKPVNSASVLVKYTVISYTNTDACHPYNGASSHQVTGKTLC